MVAPEAAGGTASGARGCCWEGRSSRDETGARHVVGSGGCADKADFRGGAAWGPDPGAHSGAAPNLSGRRSWREIASPAAVSKAIAIAARPASPNGHEMCCREQPAFPGELHLGAMQQRNSPPGMSVKSVHTRKLVENILAVN